MSQIFFGRKKIPKAAIVNCGIHLLVTYQLFQSYNHQGGNLKVQLLIKSSYYIVPNTSTTLILGTYGANCRSFAACSAQAENNCGTICTQTDGSLGICCPDIIKNSRKYTLRLLNIRLALI